MSIDIPSPKRMTDALLASDKLLNQLLLTLDISTNAPVLTGITGVDSDTNSIKNGTGGSYMEFNKIKLIKMPDTNSIKGL